MSWIGVGVAAGSAIAGIASASSSASAASKAAKSSAAAAAYAAQLQDQQYQTTREDYAPYRQAGYNALTQMQAPSFYKDFKYSNMTSDPGYSFRLNQGQKAINNSAAARGGLQSGKALKAAAAYGQEMGSQEYNNAYSRYMQSKTQNFNQYATISGLGQTANAATTASGTNAANNNALYAINNATNQGNSYLASANAWNSAYQGIGNSLGGMMASY